MGFMNHEGQGRAFGERGAELRRRVLEWLRFLGWRRVAASGAATVATAVVLLWMFLPSPPPVDDEIPAAAAVPTTAVRATPTVRVRVHVTGAVRRPGVYELSSGDRVVDALAAAGGASVDADLEAINLAQTLLDTEQILVPRRTKASPRRAPAPRLRPAPRPRTSPTTVPAPGAVTVPGVVDPSPVASSPAATSPVATVNLNTATAAELDTLPGIGPTTARAIIDHRRTKGPFRRVEDLMNVAGIGPTRFARIKALVSV
ncbi:MAG: helix-hairpin-helix domain-containing protein [Ilumatobacteraceae bacterium]